MKIKLMYGGIILVVALASIFGTMTLMPSEAEGSAEAAEGEEALVITDDNRAIYHNLRPAFIVNSMMDNKSRNLQVDLVLMARVDAVIKNVILHTPLIRNQILTQLTDQDFQFLMTNEGKELLRKDLKVLINTTLADEGVDGVIESVLYKNFVMQ